MMQGTQPEGKTAPCCQRQEKSGVMRVHGVALIKDWHKFTSSLYKKKFKLLSKWGRLVYCTLKNCCSLVETFVFIFISSSILSSLLPSLSFAPPKVASFLFITISSLSNNG
jgi:hypothetical protein